MLLIGASLAAAIAGAPADITPAGAASPAGTEASEGVVTYPAQFFAQYAPRTALEMVQRVPGFSIEGGDSDVRGFGGAAGNVLIDGARPSAKSQSAQDVLGRIPAEQVLRVELRRGGEGGDAGAQAVIVNVVRTRAGGSGVYEVELEANAENRWSPRGEGSYSGRVGDIAYTLGASRYLEAPPLGGGRTVLDGAGALVGTRVDDFPRTFREVEVSSALTAPLLGGVLSANLQASRYSFEARLDSVGFDAAGLRADRAEFSLEERERGNEIGLDYARKLGPVSLKLVALQTREWSSTDENARDRDAADAFAGSSGLRRRQASIERVLRAQGEVTGSAHAVTMFVEGSQNVLEARLGEFEDGAPVPPPPNADTVVEELRGDAGVIHGWAITPRWRVQSELAGEMSTLSQESGADRTERRFAFFKPSLQLSRTLPGSSQARLRVQRTVGQLDFGDFAATASTIDGNGGAGNSSLRPETAWRLEGALDLRMGAAGAVTTTVYREWVKDVNDLLVVEGFDAPGNIGDGQVIGVDVEATIPLRLIADGLELSAEVSAKDTEVTDPVTGRPRRASGENHLRYDIELRQSLRNGALAWSLELEGADARTSFRAAEEDRQDDGQYLSAYVEAIVAKDLKVRAFGGNLLDTDITRRRRFFAPTRAGTVSVVENRMRNRGVIYGVRLSGVF